MNCRNHLARAHRAVCFIGIDRSAGAFRRGDNLFFFDPGNQRASFARAHNQRQQPSFSLQRRHNLQQAWMANERIVVGIDANRNRSGHKQRALNCVNQFLRPLQFQNGPAMPPTRLFFSGRQSSPCVHNQRRTCSGLPVCGGNHARRNRAVGLCVNQDESAGAAILSIRIESDRPQQVQIHRADVVHVQRPRLLVIQRAQVGAMTD